ncbi:MAG: HD domain-containing phosphohydrolase [Candidatus Sericytochromatia bacterium]|nr:HD domain-containing phosphohydrolase [Candidatus Sericytochromatia bacterium]
MSSSSTQPLVRGTHPLGRVVWLDDASNWGSEDLGPGIPVRRYAGRRGLVGALATAGIVVVPEDLLGLGDLRPELERHVEEGGLLLGRGAGLIPPADGFPEELLWGWLPDGSPAAHWRMLLRTALAQHHLRQERQSAREDRDRQVERLREVHRIGLALSTERDPEALLTLILRKCREVTQADAGSLYLAEEDEQGRRILRFKLSQNDSLHVPYEEFTVALDRKSIAGTVALTGEPLLIEDVAHLPADADFAFDGAWDHKTGYTTQSMLVVPMRDRLGDVVGVVQLINRKRDPAAVLTSPEHVARLVTSFSEGCVTFASALASQAGVALENARLVRNIEDLFEGFVQASVTAIESRDPTTSGHSARVASLTVNLARVVDRCPSGALATTQFSRSQLRELRYASLLHDFGKVGVREDVLVKAKKLYPWHLERIRDRIAMLRGIRRLEDARRRLDLVLRQGPEHYETCCADMDRTLAEAEAELERWLAAITSANEPSVLDDGDFAMIQQIAAYRWQDLEGETRPLLEPAEVKLLSLRRGSLDPAERLEIERHVVHTQRFLAQIPWTRELSGIPEIAGAHHERLDGTGYPLGMTGEAIPVQSRMMAIADIHDALTAADRPYKRALPVAKAINILQDEAKAGHIDRALLDLFVTAKVWDMEDVPV